MKKRDRVMLSMKDLVFKKRPVRKLVDQYVSPYLIKEIKLVEVEVKEWEVKKY